MHQVHEVHEVHQVNEVHQFHEVHQVNGVHQVTEQEKLTKSQNLHKMGRHGSKIGLSGTNRHYFGPKMKILMSVSVKKLTFDKFFFGGEEGGVEQLSKNM